MKITPDTRITDLEFSVATTNLLQRHGIKTLGEAKEKLDWLQTYSRGWGARRTKEVTDALNTMAAQSEDLLNQPELLKLIREDQISTVQARIQEVDRSLLRIAMSGRVSRDTRGQMAALLRDAANRVEQIPAIGDKQ